MRRTPPSKRNGIQPKIPALKTGGPGSALQPVLPGLLGVSSVILCFEFNAFRWGYLPQFPLLCTALHWLTAAYNTEDLKCKTEVPRLAPFRAINTKMACSPATHSFKRHVTHDGPFRAEFPSW